jgi:hypothetical protein
VRDIYEKEDSPVQKSIKKLAAVIGYPVSCHIEWQMLWTELEPIYPDKATFAPGVAGVIQAWCNILTKRLEDEKFASWAEEFIERVEPVSSVKVVVQVS